MTSEVNLRELVLDALLAVTRDGEYSHIALKGILDKYQYLSKQERSFLTRVFEGTLEHMIWIDYVINQFSNVKVNKMKPVIRTVLRSSVYELKYMDAVPAGATCNEAVKLVQKRGFHNLKGFVNGVLRNISRNLENVELPVKDVAPVEYLSVKYSMPEWIVVEWMQQYPKENVEEMLAAFQAEAPTGIRVNTSRISREELVKILEDEGVTVQTPENIAIQAQKVITIQAQKDAAIQVPDGLFISGYDHLGALPSFQKGLFYVQGMSSMMVSHLAAPKEGDHVLDVCAAPGGKSIHMAELLKGTGMVEARDLTPNKVELIWENIRRCRLSNIKAVQADARLLREEDIETADIVIADLPCSGLGVIGRKPDIKYKMTREKQKELAALQQEILHTVSHYVKPGGILMYSTCTINREENEENVSRFLQQHPEFHLELQNQLLPEPGRQDGFFIARLKKENHE